MKTMIFPSNTSNKTINSDNKQLSMILKKILVGWCWMVLDVVAFGNSVGRVGRKKSKIRGRDEKKILCLRY
jgi:hypothetical protein